MKTMRRGVSDFLVRLGDEPELLAQYRSSPAVVLEQQGIGAENREAILSGELGWIRDRIRTEHPDVDVFNSIMKPDEPEEPPPPKPKPRPT